jgi:HSP20 family molecular chaperone IbpA
MKRMYFTLISIFLVIFYAGTLLGQQKSRDTEFMEKRMKMREEIHRRMMDKLINGNGPDQDMFKDMEEFMNESMSSSFAGATSPNYKTEWSETTAGRTLTITPNTPEQQLDINVNNGMVEIKGKIEQKTPNGSSVSNFSNSFNVPGDCDSGKVKMDSKAGKILLQFPYRVKPKNERKPIPPSKSDVQT